MVTSDIVNNTGCFVAIAVIIWDADSYVSTAQTTAFKPRIEDSLDPNVIADIYSSICVILR